MYTAPAPSSSERYCAWYGARGEDGVLYFGQAPFWSAMREADGDPTADLSQPGPALVGRFDLASERLLPPLAVGDADSRSGVWDVWFSPGGEVYFTTFYEGTGAVDPASGRVRRLDLGGGLNEWADGPDGTLLVSRYGSGTGDGGDGSLIAVGPTGEIVQDWPLSGPAGFRVAPKTPAWDPARGEAWLTADLLPTDAEPGTPDRHDAYRLQRDGGVERVPEPPELQFVARAADGTLYRAEADGSQLALRVVPPPGAGPPWSVPLDAAFAPGFDFVQDIQPAPDGRVAITRWSGRIHVLHPDGALRTTQLPRLDPDGLYYTGVLAGDRLCATYCADVSVVCTDAP